MFSCVSSVFVLALPLFAAASVLPRDDPSNQCNTGPILCCDSVVAPTDPTAALLLGLVGYIDSPTDLVGLTCTPITVVDGSSTSCSSQPVCCTDTFFGGLVAVGCIPVDLSP